MSIAATYVDNRVWMLTGHVVESQLEALGSRALSLQLDHIIESVFSGVDSTATIVVTTDPNLPRVYSSARLRLRISLSKNAVQDLTRSLGTEGWELTSLEMYLGVGFQLNVRTAFAPLGAIELPKSSRAWDDLTNRFSEWIETLEPLYRKLLQELGSKGLVVLLSNYSWGVPDFIAPARSDSLATVNCAFDEHDCWIYTGHLLFSRASGFDLPQLIELLHLESGQRCRWGSLAGACNWGWRIWSVEDRSIDLGCEQFDEILGADALFLMQLNAIGTASLANAAVMQRIAFFSEKKPFLGTRWKSDFSRLGAANLLKHPFESFRRLREETVMLRKITISRLRHFMNLTAHRMLSLSVYDRCGNSDLEPLLRQFRAADGRLEMEMQGFQRSEEAVQRAVMGLEDQRSANRTRAINWTLFIFGAFGLLSVLKDMTEMTSESGAEEFSKSIAKLAATFPLGYPFSLLAQVLGGVALFVSGIALAVFLLGRKN